MDDFFGVTGRDGPGGTADRHGPTDGPAQAEDTDTAGHAGPSGHRSRPAGDGPDGRLRPHPRPRDRLDRPDPAGAPGETQLDSAMRYRADSQTAASGAELLLEVSETHGDSIAASGDGGLLLPAGQYLISFAADAEGSGELGAVFALNGAVLPFTAALLPEKAMARRRLALTAVLHLTAAAILTVENNCGGDVTYHNAVLTAVRLS